MLFQWKQGISYSAFSGYKREGQAKFLWLILVIVYDYALKLLRNLKLRNHHK